ncbi:MAG: TetR/AcrR family transcriptional regulator [Solirubrobacteraceae bacterium]
MGQHHEGAQVPVRRDAERSRRLILDSAEDLFAQRGLKGTSMQAIAAGAGVAQGTPGYFFGSKEELYQAVLDRAIAARRDRLEMTAVRALSSELSADEGIIEATATYLDTLAKDRNFLRLIDRESLGERRIYKSEVQLQSLRDGVALIAELLERGGHTDIDARHFFISILGICEWSFSHEPLIAGLGFSADDHAFLAERKRHIAVLVAAALGVQTPERARRASKRRSGASLNAADGT